MKHHVSIEHCPEFETAVQFEYPTDELPDDMVAAIERYTDELVRVKMAESIRRLCHILEDEKDPLQTLHALLYSVGINPTNSDGSMTFVANALNISRQRFHYQKKTIGKRMSKKIQRMRTLQENPFF